MKWIKASEELPNEGEEVLFRSSGFVSLGTYHQESKKFVDRLGAGCFAPLHQIMWARIASPPDPPQKDDNRRLEG